MSDCIDCQSFKERIKELERQLADAQRLAHDKEQGYYRVVGEANGLRAEVERLKRELHHHREGDEQDGLHIITDKQIDAAHGWHMAALNGGEAYSHDYTRWILEEIGVIECPECLGAGDGEIEVFYPPDYMQEIEDHECHSCHGHGWTRGEHGDE